MGNVDEASQSRKSRRNSADATFTQRKTAKTASHVSTVVADVRQMHSISREISKAIIEIGCELQRKRVECAIMIKAALACD